MTKGLIIASNVFLGLVGMFTIIALAVILEFAQGAKEPLVGIWEVCWFVFVYLKTKIDINVKLK